MSSKLVIHFPFPYDGVAVTEHGGSINITIPFVSRVSAERARAEMETWIADEHPVVSGEVVKE